VVLALAADLFGTETLPLAVDVGDGPDAGALAIVPDGPAVTVATSVDAAAALALLAERLSAA
jgi:hypothetical protein